MVVVVVLQVDSYSALTTEGDDGARCSAGHDHGPSLMQIYYYIYLFARMMNKH